MVASEQVAATVLVKELERRAQNSGLSEFVTYASITEKPFFEKQGYMVEKENTVILIDINNW